MRTGRAAVRRSAEAEPRQTHDRQRERECLDGSILRDRTLYLPTVLRMAVMPAVVCLVMRLLGVDPEIIRISTVIAALPSGTMTSIVAADYGCAPDYAANIMVQTMLAMLAALPAWVFLVGM